MLLNLEQDFLASLKKLHEKFDIHREEIKELLTMTEELVNCERLPENCASSISAFSEDHATLKAHSHMFKRMLTHCMNKL